jgi:hypothetical protein
MPIVPLSNNSIRVGYISPSMGLINGLTVEEANAYAQSNPGTVFIFVDGDRDINYLTIEQVNNLTSADLLRKESCNTDPIPCGPPEINVIGGGGIGASINPIIDSSGTIIAVDIVNGGFGYDSKPKLQVVDACENGSGAVLDPILNDDGSIGNVIVEDGGTGYLPPPAAPTDPSYPVTLQLDEILVKDPGINYDCSNDELVIEPRNGTKLSYQCNPFGKIKSINVEVGGYFSELPNIFLRSNTGVNASFIPVFKVVRDPQEIVGLEAVQVVQVLDLVGLTIKGYRDGRPFYGNVFFENGIKYAGTSESTTTSRIRVYDTKLESINQTSNLERITEAALSRVQTDLQGAEAENPRYGYTDPTFSSAPAPSPSPAPSPAPSPSPSPSSDGGGFSGGY